MFRDANDFNFAEAFPVDPRFPRESQFDLLLGEKRGERLRCLDHQIAGIEISDGDVVLVERSSGVERREMAVLRYSKSDERGKFLPFEDPPDCGELESLDDRELRVIAKILWKFTKL